MNYFNPYFYSMPTNIVQPKIGLLGRLFGRTGISIGNFLNGTQRILNIANQTIPLVKQVRPMIGNAKTMFKVMNEFKKTDKQQLIMPEIEKKDNKIEHINNIEPQNSNNQIQNNDGPIFFL